MNDNSIRKFTCELCLSKNFYIRSISKKKEIGFICEKCWKKYNNIKNYLIS